MSLKLFSLSALGWIATALPAFAQVSVFTSTLGELNGSNATGNAILTLDEGAQTLRVEVFLANVEPDMTHAMHIHGAFTTDGDASDSTVPTLAQDTDGDGFIEVLEGVATYGDILLPLSSPPASDNDPGTQMFPTAPGGIINFDETYDLTDEGQFFSGVTGTDYSAADLFPLNFREIVVHGMTVADGPGTGTDGEVDGTSGYKAVLPIAAGEIVGRIVPEPASCLLATMAVVGAIVSRRWR